MSEDEKLGPELDTAPLEIVDDWGDFSSVLNQLEREEGVTESVTESGQPAVEDKSEAMAGFVEIAFVIIEQVTSVTAGFDFEFDEKGKQKVIDAAVPVLNKHGNGILSVFGDYVEEVTLLIAVLALVLSAKKTVAKHKLEIIENGKETTAVSVSKSG